MSLPETRSISLQARPATMKLGALHVAVRRVELGRANVKRGGTSVRLRGTLPDVAKAPSRLSRRHTTSYPPPAGAYAYRNAGPPIGSVGSERAWVARTIAASPEAAPIPTQA